MYWRYSGLVPSQLEGMQQRVAAVLARPVMIGLAEQRRNVLAPQSMLPEVVSECDAVAARAAMRGVAGRATAAVIEVSAQHVSWSEF